MRWDKENQGACENEFREGWEKQQGILQEHLWEETEKGERIPTNKQEVRSDKVHMEKAEVFNKFFTSIFTGGQVSHVSQVPESLGGSKIPPIPPTVREQQIWDSFMRLNGYKSMGPHDIHL